MRKKGQLKMGETIIVLIIFFILLAGGMVFYAKISSFTHSRKMAEVGELDAIGIEQRIRHMAELPCTVDGDVVFDCYDLQKVYALQQTIDVHRAYYAGIIFKNSRVVFTTVYPGASEEILLYDFGGVDESVGVEPFRTPVTLYDPVEDMYKFGYITIEVFS